MSLLHNTLVVLTVVPFIPFLLVYFITYFVKQDKKAALLLAMDVTTVFLILCTAALFNNLFDSGFGFYLILIILLIAAGLIGGAQNRLKGGVDVKRLIRAVWRLAFAGTGIAYVLLFLIGLITYISAV